MRYLVLGGHLPPSCTGGGVIRYTVEYLRGLAERPDVDLTVVVAPGSEAGVQRLVPDAQIRTLPGRSVVGRSLREVAGLLGGLDGIDVVHGMKQLLPLRSSGPAQVLTVYDMLVLDRPGDFPLAKRALLRAPYAASLDRADALLAISEATADRLVHHRPHLAGRVAVVPLAVSSALQDVAPEPVPALDGTSFALAVGDPSPRKNLRLLLDVWDRVHAVSGARLALVGPPAWGPHDGAESLRRLVATGAVVHLGHVPDAQLRWLYEHCAVALAPSRAEGFGFPTAEAVTFGAPLLRSTDPAQREAAGGAGRELDPDDREGWCAAVLEVVAQRRAARPAGLTHAARTWSDVVGESVAAAAVAVGRVSRG